MQSKSPEALARFGLIFEMPIRVKSRPQSMGDRADSPHPWTANDYEMPDINHDDAFRDVVKKLSMYASSSWHTLHGADILPDMSPTLFIYQALSSSSEQLRLATPSGLWSSISASMSQTQPS